MNMRNIAMLSLNVRDAQLPHSLHSRHANGGRNLSSPHCIGQTESERRNCARNYILSQFVSDWGKFDRNQAKKSRLDWDSFQYMMSVPNPWVCLELWNCKRSSYPGKIEFPLMP